MSDDASPRVEIRNVSTPEDFARNDVRLSVRLEPPPSFVTEDHMAAMVAAVVKPPTLTLAESICRKIADAERGGGYVSDLAIDVRLDLTPDELAHLRSLVEGA